MSRPSPRTRLAPIAALTLALAACTTAGAQLESSPTAALPFDAEPAETTLQPVTEPDEPTVDEPAAPAIDAAIAGPDFPEAANGPTLAVTGQDGVWWFDANGQAHLVVEPARAADYDGSGGLVFQRTEAGPIVRRTSQNEELDLVAPGAGEELRLVGVAEVNGQNEVIYLRNADGSSLLERATLDDGITSSIADLTRNGVSPSRLTISGSYVTAVHLEGAGAGWTTVSSASGSKLFGTPAASLGSCADRSAGCPEVVTVTPDGTTVYQVQVAADGGWDLVVNNAADFSEVARVSLQRPADGWHPAGLEAINGLVIVSRTANADGTGDLPALSIDPTTGEITQLARTGVAVAVTG